MSEKLIFFKEDAVSQLIERTDKFLTAAKKGMSSLMLLGLAYAELMFRHKEEQAEKVRTALKDRFLKTEIFRFKEMMANIAIACMLFRGGNSEPACAQVFTFFASLVPDEVEKVVKDRTRCVFIGVIE